MTLTASSRVSRGAGEALSLSLSSPSAHVARPEHTPAAPHRLASNGDEVDANAALGRAEGILRQYPRRAFGEPHVRQERIVRAAAQAFGVDALW